MWPEPANSLSARAGLNTIWTIPLPSLESRPVKSFVGPVSALQRFDHAAGVCVAPAAQPRAANVMLTLFLLIAPLPGCSGLIGRTRVS